MPGNFPSALMISSVMPSEKYSFSGSALMFLNGRTAIALGADLVESVMVRCGPVPSQRTESGFVSLQRGTDSVVRRVVGRQLLLKGLQQ